MGVIAPPLEGRLIPRKGWGNTSVIAIQLTPSQKETKKRLYVIAREAGKDKTTPFILAWAEESNSETAVLVELVLVCWFQSLPSTPSTDKGLNDASCDLIRRARPRDLEPSYLIGLNRVSPAWEAFYHSTAMNEALALTFWKGVRMPVYVRSRRQQLFLIRRRKRPGQRVGQQRGKHKARHDRAVKRLHAGEMCGFLVMSAQLAYIGMNLPIPADVCDRYELDLVIFRGTPQSRKIFSNKKTWNMPFVQFFDSGNRQERSENQWLQDDSLPDSDLARQLEIKVECTMPGVETAEPDVFWLKSPVPEDGFNQKLTVVRDPVGVAETVLGLLRGGKQEDLIRNLAEAERKAKSIAKGKSRFCTLNVQREDLFAETTRSVDARETSN